MLRMIPVMVMTIPFYLLFKQLGWINSLPALTLCYTALSLPLATWLCMGFTGIFRTVFMKRPWWTVPMNFNYFTESAFP